MGLKPLRVLLLVGKASPKLGAESRRYFRIHLGDGESAFVSQINLAATKSMGLKPLRVLLLVGKASPKLGAKSRRYFRIHLGDGESAYFSQINLAATKKQSMGLKPLRVLLLVRQSKTNGK